MADDDKHDDDRHDDGAAPVTKGRSELRASMLAVARCLEEDCLKLLTDVSHCRSLAQDAADEANQLDTGRAAAARKQLQTALEQAPEAARTAILQAYLEVSKVVYAMAAARERERELVKRAEAGGNHLDALQQAIVNLNSLVREIDGGTLDPSVVGPGARHQFDRELEKSILMAQEDEKRRVSIVVHDGPAQILANLIMRIDFCSRLLTKKPEEAGGELLALRKEMQDLLDDVRRLIFELRPMTLDDLGFVPTLQRFVENMKPTVPFDLQLAIRGQVPEPPNLTAVVLYRTIQEAVTNAAKHATATRCSIRLKAIEEEGVIWLEVEDDGRGFDATTLPQMVALGRLGLHAVDKRINLVDGSFSITSAPGTGTTLTVSVPLAPRP